LALRLTGHRRPPGTDAEHCQQFSICRGLAGWFSGCTDFMDARQIFLW
jgi:hypothetical protein